MKAALLNKNNKVIGQVFDAPAEGNTIEIAGDFTISGDPVRVFIYKISRSKRNLEKAEFEIPVYKTKSGVYTWGDC